jgi:hypothetical protein
MESLDKLIETLVHSTTESLTSDTESVASDSTKLSQTSADQEELIFTPSAVDGEFEELNESVLSRKLHDQLHIRAMTQRRSSVRYLHENVEIKAIIMLVVRAVLEHKPGDVEAFLKEYFAQKNRDEFDAEVK